MPKYKVQAHYTTYLTLDIEADSLDDAIDIASFADGGDFKETDKCDWNIDSVKEVKQ
jgi:hypothetical protein